MEALLPLPLLAGLLLWGAAGSGTELDPNGRHVCRSDSQPHVLTCCPGWKQAGPECPTALCVGLDACREDEVCVRPGICRCRPGFFGANCITQTGIKVIPMLIPLPIPILPACPGQYWGPDCKESCPCFPNGTCDPASGQCTCRPDHWGPRCQFKCRCGPNGRCDPLAGLCRCKPGWWSGDCRRLCQCNPSGSRCDSGTGRCLCHPGWWGPRCSALCRCNGSPCAPATGQCECRAGLWGPGCQHPCSCLHGACSPHDGRCSCDDGYRGPGCAEPCPAGTYGRQCGERCGHCTHPEACSPADGVCPACHSGWIGTQCKRPCPAGRHGENCTRACPHCLRGEPCHPETGACRDCEPGRRGASCEEPCPAGFFGAACRAACPACSHGSCHPVTGQCLCQAGYWGTSCNQTCPEGLRGPNCSEPCLCGEGGCPPSSGGCAFGMNREVLLAGILTPLLLLLLCICCCYCCCRSAPADANERAAAANPISRMKHHVLGTLANVSNALPCFSLGAYKLPRVTVSHHDAEIPFNPSFIEPPSAAWPLDSSFSSSFDTPEETEDKDGPVYQLPASEAPEAELQGGPAPNLPTEPFAIPRTSSLAKAKRPSVSFAEGTRFGPQSPRGSTEALWKPKAGSGGPLRVAGSGREPPQADAAGSLYENVEAACREEEAAAEGPRVPPPSTPGGRRKQISGSWHVAQRVEALEAAAAAAAARAQGGGREPGISTIYVTVGQAGGGSQGPRQGSLPRARPPPRKEPRLRRSLEGLPKLPWRKLEKNSRRLRSQGEIGPEATGLGLELELATAAGAKGRGLLGGQPGESPSLAASQRQAESSALQGGSSEKAAQGEEPQYENVSATA
ncbi:scavenger receptor class F member 1 isoform X2 [Hemicordylus capensis]|uniref:scavenger receptor class F member 1 isoform X2 n=1 Tax=Hemicordylus capensis TaxID=884348 RepID=UPI002304B27A|nr:scavenger receptor class F member 1 isoform X2 [Hemicordylus capensis]